MRKPFYRKSREAWYHTAKMKNGKLKQVFLSQDKDEAFAIWEEHYRPREIKKHEPVGVREVIVTKTVTETVTRTSPPLASSPEHTDDEREDGSMSLGRRYSQFERLLLLVELLTPLRRGATAKELLGDVIDLLGTSINPATIKRDLRFLSEAGVVDTEDGRRFRWRGASVRAVVMERMSEAFGDRHGVA